MVQKIVSLVRRTGTEARLWSYAAWTLPFTALALLVFEHFIGWDSLMQRTLVLITVTFFTISVFWWWWALNKIVVILRYISSNTDHFEEIKRELQATRQTIREIENVGDR